MNRIRFRFRAPSAHNHFLDHAAPSHPIQHPASAHPPLPPQCILYRSPKHPCNPPPPAPPPRPPRRSATGVDKGRLATLCAILDKHVPTLELANCSVIVNVVGGAQVWRVCGWVGVYVCVCV